MTAADNPLAPGVGVETSERSVCHFCGYMPWFNETNCLSYEQALDASPKMPFGCPWLNGEERVALEEKRRQEAALRVVKSGKKAMQDRVETSERALIDVLRSDLARAEGSAAETKCEGCDAVIFDDEVACHSGDVVGCWPFVHGVNGGYCWRYRTEKGMDRSWPDCPLARRALATDGARDVDR